MKFSRSKEDTQFAFNFDPLINNTGNLSYLKHYNYFDLKLDTNYSFVNENPGYGVNLQLSNTFKKIVITCLISNTHNTYTFFLYLQSQFIILHKCHFKLKIA